MGKAVAVTPAQVKAAQMRRARMIARGEKPPEKLVKIAEATSKQPDPDTDQPDSEDYRPYEIKRWLESLAANHDTEPGLFSVPDDAAVGALRVVPLVTRHGVTAAAAMSALAGVDVPHRPKAALSDVEVSAALTRARRSVELSLIEAEVALLNAQAVALSERPPAT